MTPVQVLQRRVIKKQKNARVLRPVHPNSGIEAEYRRSLRKIIEDMHCSVLYWVRAAYRANEPEVLAQDKYPPFESPGVLAGGDFAFDALPASALRAAVRKLVRRWQRRFDDMAAKLASYFATSASDRSDRCLRKILKDGGISVEFRMTRAQRDVLRATVNQNVSLIKSIPQQYLHGVETSVMRSVQTGRDLGHLTDTLEKQYGATRRRAALIARDQNNKCTSALVRARQLELGITESIWLHSHAGKKPRPTHVKMDGKKFDVAKGMWDSHENKWILPGELVNCRCVSRSIVAGFS